jgi:hypothetical protein
VSNPKVCPNNIMRSDGLKRRGTSKGKSVFSFSSIPMIDITTYFDPSSFS